jgi:hypothetical protein
MYVFLQNLFIMNILEYFFITCCFYDFANDLPKGYAFVYLSFFLLFPKIVLELTSNIFK